MIYVIWCADTPDAQTHRTRLYLLPSTHQDTVLTEEGLHYRKCRNVIGHDDAYMNRPCSCQAILREQE
jgi:hypothetical protein